MSKHFIIASNCVTPSYIYNLLNCVPVGAKCKDERAVENMIHIYLIVAGAVGLFVKCCSCDVDTRYQGRNQGEEKRLHPLLAVQQHFFFAWFICGKMWIYEKLKTDLLRARLGWQWLPLRWSCTTTLIMFAFWVANSCCIIFGLVQIKLLDLSFCNWNLRSSHVSRGYCITSCFQSVIGV